MNISSPVSVHVSNKSGRQGGKRVSEKKMKVNEKKNLGQQEENEN